MKRRSFLRGAGALLPLPILETLMPSIAVADPPPLRRWGVFYFPMGCYRDDFVATADAEGLPQLPAFLEGALASVRSDLLWINGLDNLQEGKGGHETAAGTFLCCGDMLLPGPEFPKSADQIVADQLSASYSVPSLVLSAPGFQIAASCCRDVELGLNHISWRGGTTPAPKLQDPRAVFDSIFVADLSPEGLRQAALRRARRRSILDFGRTQARRLELSLITSDRERLQAYFDSIREIERRIDVAESSSAMCAPPDAPPEGPSFEDHNQLMWDLAFLAFQCNVTPVVSFMMDFEFSDRLISTPGVSSGHHGVSHHEDTAGKIDQFRAINAFYAARFARFVERAKTVRDPDGRTLLENSIFQLCSGMSDGNDHDRRNLPMLIAGNGGGAVRTGRVLEADRPLADLYRSIMRVMGASGPDVDNFGDATTDLPLA